MSFDQVVLIVFLVVLPLLQYLRRDTRQRTAPPKQAKAPASAKPQPSREQQPALSLDAEALADGAVDQGARQIAATTNLGKRPGLRRAIVLMTLIGPCRAANPHDLPDSGWRVSMDV